MLFKSVNRLAAEYAKMSKQANMGGQIKAVNVFFGHKLEKYAKS
jgi:hypothetical protein